MLLLAAFRRGPVAAVVVLAAGAHAMSPAAAITGSAEADGTATAVNAATAVAIDAIRWVQPLLILSLALPGPCLKPNGSLLLWR